MRSGKNSKILLGSGLLLALTSSLCCIVPILALIGGAGSSVGAFSWAAPLRPYLLSATGLVLGLAFYQAYKPKPNEKDACGCDGKEKKNGLQSKTFLWVITGASILLSVFPYYAKYLQPKVPVQQIIGNNSNNVQQAVLQVQGMDCEACEGHVNSVLLQKKGVLQVITSYAKGQTTVKFDSAQISLRQLATTIENETDYKVTNK